MDLKYSLTRSECLEMSRSYNARYSMSAKMKSHVIFETVFISIFATFLIRTSGLNLPISAVIGILAAVPLQRYLARLCAGKLYDQHSALKQEMHLRVDERCLYFACEDFRCECDWKAIKEIREDKLGFYLRLSSDMKILIPRRVFASEQELQHFSVLSHEYLEHARPKMVPVKV